MYRLDLYSTDGLTRDAALFSPDIAVERYSKRINAPGTLVFSIKATNPKATESNLRLFRRVRLYRQSRDGSGYAPVWFGYILEKNELDGRVEVVCDGMLGFFTKRFTTDSETFTGEGSSEAFGLLSDANTDDETGVSQGTGGVTTTRSVTAQGRIDLLKAWELLAQAHDAEFEIDDSGAFHFVPVLGSDQSATVHLRFHRDGKPGTNLNAIQIGDSGKDMANRVFGLSSAGYSYQYDDPTSQATYGLLTTVKQFNEAQDLATLTTMTTAYGTQVSNPPPYFQINPTLASKKVHPRTGERTMSGLDYGDVSVGDLITVTTITENRSETAAKRIAEVEMTVDENGQEQMALTLTEAGIFIAAGYLDVNRIDDLATRVRQIENVIQ